MHVPSMLPLSNDITLQKFEAENDIAFKKNHFFVVNFHHDRLQ